MPVQVVENWADIRGRIRSLVEPGDVGMQDAGRDTVKLPLPDVSTLNAASPLSGDTGPAKGDPTLATGTRVRVIGPHPTLKDFVRVEVIDGAVAGRTGAMSQSALTKEALGTR